MESEQYLQHRFADVPFHELLETDVSQLNEAELRAFVLTTRGQRVAPSERKKAKTSAAKVLSGKKQKTTTDDLAHLL